MDIILAEHAGFCKGVKDAVDLALKNAAAKDASPLCTLGPLVHNDDVIGMLETHDVRVYQNPEDIPRGYRVIIRTHGTTPEKLQYLAEHGQTVLDATCSFVKHVQKIIARESAAGKQVIIIGDPNHPEVVGLKGWGSRVLVFPNLDSLCLEAIEPQAVIVAQTTYIPEDFDKIAAAVKRARPEVKIYNTICHATSLRQKAAARIAGEVDTMIIIGGANSSNTQKLAKLCLRINKNSYHINTPAELDALAWGGIRKVGVTAGASTPDWTIKEVLGKMENNLQDTQQESIDGKEALKDYQVGDKVSGRVVQINSEEVLVDIGYKTEGVLPVSEIFLKPGESLQDTIKPDEVLELQIKEINDDEGIIILSKKGLDREQAWLKLQEAMENKITMRATVKEAVQAGIIVALDAGLEGFMPGSLVDFKFIPDFKELIGNEVDFKVIEINREKAKVILSRKMVLEEKQEKKKLETLNCIKEGDLITGEVKRLTDFGAFIDVGGIDGLVHISEISWKRIGHPRDVLSVGEEVSVKVLEIIPEKERIGLSLRQAKPDPWSLVTTKCAVGDIVQGKVTRVVNFGAFVELFPGVEGLVHISQLADYHVKHPSEVVQDQQNVNVKILDINPEAKRISLSIKEAQEKNVGGSAASHYEAEEDRGVTLGDVFGNLFENDDDKNSDQE